MVIAKNMPNAIGRGAEKCYLPPTLRRQVQGLSQGLYPSFGLRLRPNGQKIGKTKRLARISHESSLPHMQGAGHEAIIIYRECLATLQMW